MSQLITKKRLSEIQQLVELDVAKWGEDMREASLRLHYQRHMKSIRAAELTENPHDTQSPLAHIHDKSTP